MDTAYRTVKNGSDYGDVQIVAVHNGGPYIDLFWGHDLESAFEVINVWDYRTGKLIDNLSVSRKLSEWIKDTGTAEIRNYYRHTA